MGISLPFESSVYNELCPVHEYCPLDSVGNTVKEVRFEDLDISTISEEDDLTVQELGIALDGILNVGDSHECFPENAPTGDLGESWNQNDIENASVDTNVLQGFQIVKTSQCAREISPKLVSAMKGSRVQQGIPPVKLSVKWAPDVYDPPAKAESHTVKVHFGRPKPIKKDNHKQKSKSKSSRGSGGERKHASRRISSSSSIDPRILRLRALNGGIPPVDSPGQLKLEVLDYAVRAQELKSCSSFYMESLVPKHLSSAEAS